MAHFGVFGSFGGLWVIWGSLCHLGVFGSFGGLWVICGSFGHMGVFKSFWVLWVLWGLLVILGHLCHSGHLDRIYRSFWPCYIMNSSF